MTKFIRITQLIIRIRREDFQGYERTLTIRNLRMAFSIQKNLAIQTNPGLIKIWGLSANYRNLIKDFGDQVELYAGYEEASNLQLLYKGDTTTVYHSFEMPEVITTLECGDGEKYVNQKTFSLSFEAGTPVEDVIRSIASRMGINVAEYVASSNPVYELGFSNTGLLKESLNKACAYAGLQWSVQNDGLQVIPLNGTSGRPPYRIDADNGMIGVPERYTYKGPQFYTNNRAVGWKVNNLLSPLILPGYRVDIRSRYLGFQGIFLVQTVRHNGDTYADPWFTNLEVTQLPG